LQAHELSLSGGAETLASREVSDAGYYSNGKECQRNKGED
jgi:hypothetical protein